MWGWGAWTKNADLFLSQSSPGIYHNAKFENDLLKTVDATQLTNIQTDPFIHFLPSEEKINLDHTLPVCQGRQVGLKRRLKLRITIKQFFIYKHQVQYIQVGGSQGFQGSTGKFKENRTFTLNSTRSTSSSLAPLGKFLFHTYSSTRQTSHTHAQVSKLQGYRTGPGDSGHTEKR